MKIIKKEEWNRSEIYNFFSTISHPFYMTTFTVDITKLYNFVKENKLSFYYSMVYICTKAINEVEAFHYGAKNGKIIYYKERLPSFTDMHKDSENFHIVTMLSCGNDIRSFCHDAAQKSKNQNRFIAMEEEGDNLIYISSLPWIELTALTNERDMSTNDALDDSIPRIAWGKYTKQCESIKLNISLEVNHKFIDGIHIGKFAEKLEKLIESLNAL
ncbi:MAG: CatA-like O-acetyltransferase [Clostridia bacterium]|nr:CatA-like O-acetyltransferase [Clostridia bacterium]